MCFDEGFCCRYHNEDEKQLKDFKTFNEYWAYKNSYKETDFVEDIIDGLYYYACKKYKDLDVFTLDLVPELTVEIVNEVRDKEVVFVKPLNNLSVEEIKRIYHKKRYLNKFIDNSDPAKFRVLIIYNDQCYIKNTNISFLLHQLKHKQLGV